ncbi:GTPase IMAP family member 8 isoform X1 [Gasterosteus aculeatus]
MESPLEEPGSTTLTEVRLVLIGERWSGKSFSGNTILGKDALECGRARTAQTEVRHARAEGRRLVVVDGPGWSGSLSLAEIPEVDKQRFKLHASACPPGPHAFLLVVPLDTAFSAGSRRTVEEHMKLLGEAAWRHTLLLFTCGDFLGERTIEQHIEGEGESLRWLTERCGNRYHVFHNKEKGNLRQVQGLLEKVEEMAQRCGFFRLDEATLNAVKEKQREAEERAKERKRRAEEQRRQRRELFPEGTKPLPELRLVVLGSRGVGKTSVGNTIFGSKERGDGRRTSCSAAHRGLVGGTRLTVVDTPGWWKSFSASDTPEATKEQLRLSALLCPPGPHAFLLAIDADGSFGAEHLRAAESHMELLGGAAWRRTVVVFTRGDWVGGRGVEVHIEGEGEALRSLVERCENRYHVIDNKNEDDGKQVAELLEKISEAVAADGGGHFVPDQEELLRIQERRLRVEEAAEQRRSQVVAKRNALRDATSELLEITIVMLGQKTSGKSATGNHLLSKEVFPTCENKTCQVAEGSVAGRSLTVIDTPGWRNNPSACTEAQDKEIVRGLSLSPQGVHAVLLAVAMDQKFGDDEQAALEAHVGLLGAGVWRHAVVLLTHGDSLAGRSVEEHIELESGALRRLVERCENRYHVVNNSKRADPCQTAELFQKMEEMVAANGGQLFHPEVAEVHLRIEEKFASTRLKEVMRRRLEAEFRQRELELMEGFKETLLRLQGSVRSRSNSLSVVQKKVGKSEERINRTICLEIEKLDKEMKRKSSVDVQSSMDFLLPEFSTATPASQGGNPSRRLDNVLGWLSKLQVGEENFSQTSGYRSELDPDPNDLNE